MVTGSILGLLAFVLAFNLSIATTRHNERRLASLEEANAIGTSWLQAKVIDTAHAAAIARFWKTTPPNASSLSMPPGIRRSSLKAWRGPL